MTAQTVRIDGLEIPLTVFAKSRGCSIEDVIPMCDRKVKQGLLTKDANDPANVFWTTAEVQARMTIQRGRGK